MKYKDREYPLLYKAPARLKTMQSCYDLFNLRELANNRLQSLESIFNAMNYDSDSIFTILKNMGLKIKLDKFDNGRYAARNTLQTYIDKNEAALKFIKKLDDIDLYYTDLISDGDIYEVVNWIQGKQKYRPRNIIEVDFPNLIVKINGEYNEDELIYNNYLYCSIELPFQDENMIKTYRELLKI